MKVAQLILLTAIVAALGYVGSQLRIIEDKVTLELHHSPQLSGSTPKPEITGISSTPKHGLYGPGRKEVTILSEVRRGQSAADHAWESSDPQSLRDRCNQVRYANEQANTDSDGFQLGLQVRLVTVLLKIANDPSAAATSRVRAQQFAYVEGVQAKALCMRFSKMDVEILFDPDEISRLTGK